MRVTALHGKENTDSFSHKSNLANTSVKLQIKNMSHAQEHAATSGPSHPPPPSFLPHAVLPVTVVPAPNTARPTKRARTKAADAGLTTIYNPDEKTYALLVRSQGPIETCASVTIKLSEPGSDEECSIAMEPIATYRLDFLSPKACLIKNHPELTKGCLPCGHSFSALALLYHFAKNSMTCPCCRGGHEREKMGEQSIPAHLRKSFSKHLQQERARDTREQIAVDSITATRMMQHEVSFDMLSLPVTRIVLSLCAYATMDRSSSPDPMLALELPLTSSLTAGVMESASFGYSLQQLNLNLRILPATIAGFELAVGVRSLHANEWGSVCLFRTVRFNGRSMMGETNRVIPSASGDARLKLDVETIPNYAIGNPQFARLAWRIPVPDFTDLLLRISHEIAMEAMGGQMAAV